jgi:hypothetical protein
MIVNEISDKVEKPFTMESMKNKVYVFDDFFGPNLNGEFHGKFIRDMGRVPWWRHQTAFAGGKEDALNHSFAHVPLNDGAFNSEHGEWTRQAILQIGDKLMGAVDSVHRIRIGLIPATETTYEHDPHIDLDLPHITALYYINDCDGDTVLYNESYDPEFYEHSQYYLKHHLKGKLTERVRIKPKANRLVVFDGLIYHNSSTPTTSSSRVVMNANFFLRDMSGGF